MHQVLIVGGGFAGLNAAKALGNKKGIQVTLIDRRNHHLFQPLLYQVAMAGLSPAEIAAPIRNILAGYRNVRVLQEEATGIDLQKNRLLTNNGELSYDSLLIACGAEDTYFGHNNWEEHAPGLKSIEQATEIRRRVLTAFETAERCSDREEQKKLLTFVVIGGGPTGVELAGAIGEMSRFTLAREFRNIDPTLTRVLLVEAGATILPTFSEKLRRRAMRDLERLGVQVWTSSRVSNVDALGVNIGGERICTRTVLWAAGIRAARFGDKLDTEKDNMGRLKVNGDLSLPGSPNVFVAGDQALSLREDGSALPGVAPVAFQQGTFVGKTILRDLKGKPRADFSYWDKGQMATIGKSRAIVETNSLKLSGFFAWVAWLLVHIYYLTGFKNRFFVTLQWAWSYLTYRRGARLIVNKEWRTCQDETRE